MVSTRFSVLNSSHEQQRLFSSLPNHLFDMALFAVNTGCRDAEICNLRWEWYVDVPALDSGVFIIPSEYVKNGDERLVVLNSIAHDIVSKQRGKNSECVFSYKGEPITRMLNSAWLRARLRSLSKFEFMILNILLGDGCELRV